MKHKKVVIGCAAIIAIPLIMVIAGFIVGFCQGLAARFLSKPTFFGVKLGDEYQCEYSKDEESAVGCYLYWLKNKYCHYERPYVFGGINMEKNVEANIRGIPDFYGQDMALLLVTRNTKKVIGIVVAAKCNKKDVQQVADEIKTTVIRKHKNVIVVDRLESWQNSAMAGFVRRPALDCVAIPMKHCKLICADENFEVNIMGVNFQTVPAPIINEEGEMKSDINTDLRLPSVAWRANFCYTDRPEGESIYSKLSKIDGFVEWQVAPQTLEEMAEERELRKFAINKQAVDLDASYVYVLILLRDYVKYIDADEAKALLNEQLRQALEQRKQEQIRRKNADAL